MDAVSRLPSKKGGNHAGYGGHCRIGVTTGVRRAASDSSLLADMDGVLGRFPSLESIDSNPPEGKNAVFGFYDLWQCALAKGCFTASNDFRGGVPEAWGANRS